MRVTVSIGLLLLSLHSAAQDFSPARPLPSAILEDDQKITRIALGSCYTSFNNSDILTEISASDPDVFVFLGDNVYADDESADPELMSLRIAYGDLVNVESFSALRKSIPILPIWDDHDYGTGDGGGDFPARETAEALFEYVWAVDESDPRANRPGVYFERTIGQGDQKVQFILLDTRFFRTPLTLNPEDSVEPYIPSEDPDQNLLGDDQWQWFNEQLQKPADLRIIVSTIQLIAEGHAWEAWRMMPKEQQRFYDLLNSTNAEGVIVVSGDRHHASLYKIEGKAQYPIFELTSSSMNIPLTSIVENIQVEPGPNRIGDPFYESNYALIDIDWKDGEVMLKILDENSKLVRAQAVSIEGLRR